MPRLPPPAPAVAICEFTPITCPLSSRSGPPEVPGVGPAGVAGFDGRVGRDHSVDREAVGRLDLAAEPRHDALGGGAVEPERVPDRDRHAADVYAGGVSELERLPALRPRARADRHDGEVARGV